MLGPESLIFDYDGHPLKPLDRRKKPSSTNVKLGKNVTIGARSIVLKGVVIGDNCFVGAHTLVSKSSPSGCVIRSSYGKNYQIN